MVRIGAAGLAGPVAGLALQVAAFASSGGLGSGRLSQLGVRGWAVGLLATAVVSAGAVAGASLAGGERRGTSAGGDRRSKS
jgi:hypothetical protein